MSYSLAVTGNQLMGLFFRLIGAVEPDNAIGFNGSTMLNASLLKVQYACLLLRGHGHHGGPHSGVSHQLPLLAVSLNLEL